MFGHLNLLAALFFIGTLKGELSQRKLNTFFINIRGESKFGMCW